MAGMLPPLIRTRQPQQATGISAYWRSKGLVFVHNPALGEVNLANNRGAINTTGFPSDVGIAGRRINAAGASKSEFTDNGLSGSGNSLTLISIWRAKDAQYSSGDATRLLLSTRTSGNAGWGWGRISAIAGGATGNLTAQTLVLNGVAQYSEANSTIESLVDTVVALRVNGTAASWFRFGKKSSTDTTVGTASTGATTIFGAGGPYSGAATLWNDRAYLTLGFNKPLSDADIFALCKDVNSPWQVFAPIQRKIFASVVGGGGNATAFASFASITLLASTALATGTALASGSPANIILTPTTGTASSSNSATASGSFQGLAITPSTGGAAGSGSAAGSLGAITLTPITGTATGSTAGGATASGAFAPISVSAATALAVGSAMTQGGFQSIGITAATGTASGTSASSATATGSFASITLTPATGTATSPGTMTLTQADIDAIVAAVLVALNATTIPVDVQKMNAAELIGSGTIGDDWRGLGVPPQ